VSPEAVTAALPAEVPLTDRIANRLVLARLASWRAGSITVVLPNGAVLRFGDGSSARRVRIVVKQWRFFWRTLTAADIGNGESYMDGDWEVSDLVELCRLYLIDQSMLDANSTWTWPNRLRNAWLRWSRRNTLFRARRNVQAHYDLSNEFYRLFLDDSMTYSCATFDGQAIPLAEAQARKIADVCRRLTLAPEHHLLEIGSGWGALAIHAARTYGCRVTSLTLSEEQLRLARERVREAGLEDRVEIRLCDYREARGVYDRAVSIEMFEAVGWEYYGDYFSRIQRLLKPDGSFLMQTITVPDQRFDEYRQDFDWIRKWIFPGGLLPSVAEITRAVGAHSDFRIAWMRDVGIDYAPTLRAWRETFLERVAEVRSLGFDDRFVRMWEYYLASCEAAFSIRYLGDAQILFARPLAK
jgi:cyclopropane-fatty-acyl-phospholipid synthase